MQKRFGLYFEVYNRANVRLVDISETPIERITPTGIQTSDNHSEFDIIVYATGFDAITGSFDRIEISGVGGETLKDKWNDGAATFLGLTNHGFPNLVMIAGPQSGSGSANFPRSIETAVNWTTDLFEHVFENQYLRFEPTIEAEQRWSGHVEKLYAAMLMRNAKGWVTGYNSNVPGHEAGKIRHLIYNGGNPKYMTKIDEVAQNGYAGLTFN